MHHNSEAPRLTGSIVRNGAAVISKGVVPQDYTNAADIATGSSYAAAKITQRFQIRIETARVVCDLSGLGGAAQ